MILVCENTTELAAKGAILAAQEYVEYSKNQSSMFSGVSSESGGIVTGARRLRPTLDPLRQS